MSSKRFGIDIAFNTSEVAKGAKDAEKSLDKLEDAVEDLGKGGARDAERLEDALKDVQRQSERTDDAIDDIRGTGDRAFDGIKEGAQEVSQEIGQNVGQAVSSFRGDLQDLGQVGQDTLGGLAATLASGGPAGIAGAAALAAGAVGLGLVTAEFERQQEEAQKLRERLGGLYQEALESGRDYIDQAQFIGESNDLMFNPDRADEWKKLQQDAKTLGMETTDIIKANAGDLVQQEIVQQRINELKAEANSQDSTAEGLLKAAQSDLVNMEERWRNITTVTDEYKAANEAAARATSKFLLEAIANAGTVAEEIDEVGNKLYELPDGEQIMIDVETGRATQALDKFQGDADEVIEYISGREAVMRVRVDRSEWDRFKNEPKQFDARVRVLPGEVRWE